MTAENNLGTDTIVGQPLDVGVSSEQLEKERLDLLLAARRLREANYLDNHALADSLGALALRHEQYIRDRGDGDIIADEEVPVGRKALPVMGGHPLSPWK